MKYVTTYTHMVVMMRDVAKTICSRSYLHKVVAGSHVKDGLGYTVEVVLEEIHHSLVLFTLHLRKVNQETTVLFCAASEFGKFLHVGYL